MARSMNNEGEGNTDGPDGPAGPGHNSVKIDERIAQAAPEIFALEQEIKALTETHLAPVRKKLSKVWQLLKGDTGFSIKYMKVAGYNIYKLAEEAKLFEDDNDKRDALEAINLTFLALQKGGHLDLLRDIESTDEEKPEEKPDEKPDEKTDEKPSEKPSKKGA